MASGGTTLLFSLSSYPLITFSSVIFGSAGMNLAMKVVQRLYTWEKPIGAPQPGM